MKMESKSVKPVLEGILSEKIRFNRPGSIDMGEIIIRIDFLIKAGEKMKGPGPLACHKATEFIVQDIAQLSFL